MLMQLRDISKEEREREREREREQLRRRREASSKSTCFAIVVLFRKLDLLLDVFVNLVS